MKAVVFALALGAAACKSEAPVLPDAGSRPETSATLPTSRGVRLVTAPAPGEVDAIVRDALVASGAGGAVGRDSTHVLLVYVGATWCEPCQKFHHAVERGDLDSTFPGLTLLEFDLDRDRERLASAGFVSKYIPLFALPRRDGTASGKQVEGGIKGDGAVAFIVPRLAALLRGGP
jgi:thiol-disulfide isomerase/thioredoxin